MNGKTPKTFRTKIILYNMLILICIASAISYYNYNSYKKDAIKNAVSSAATGINILSSRLELAHNEMMNLVQNCAERKSLFLSTTLNTNFETFSPRMDLYSASVLRDFCAISGYSQYIYKLTLVYKDQVAIQAGSQPGAADDIRQITEAPWFYEKVTSNQVPYALTMEDNPFPLGKTATPQILPLVRPLKYQYGDIPEEAWVFLGISPRLYSDALQSMMPHQIIYAVTKSGEIIASKNGDRFQVTDLIARIQSDSVNTGILNLNLNGKPCVVTYQKQDISGVTVFEILPLQELTLDRHVVTSTVTIVFFFCIAIGLTLSFLISRLLSAPIRRLTERLEILSEGNFDTDSSIETDDEIGMIGKQINHMSQHISNLMETRIRNEKEKKDMEIKMLQAQINPHFLYNTLDSIKWIATIQKNTGIVQVVTALSSLLKNMAKGFNEKVTLQQELDFLQNYITIEKIRYIELFDVEISVEHKELYRAHIIKLTLQPIVENAIFSGIEPSGRTGIIKIHVFTKNGVLYVTITDNGIGISPENIQNILTDTTRITKSNMSGIGLPNVDRRLKLVYGEDYGLTIESKLDSYTKITISLPLELQS